MQSCLKYDFANVRMTCVKNLYILLVYCFRWRVRFVLVTAVSAIGDRTVVAALRLYRVQSLLFCELFAKIHDIRIYQSDLMAGELST